MTRLAVVVAQVIVAVTAAASAAEPLVIDLWPGKAPGDVGISGQENSRSYNSPLLDKPTRLITNFSRGS